MKGCLYVKYIPDIITATYEIGVFRKLTYFLIARNNVYDSHAEKQHFFQEVISMEAM